MQTVHMTDLKALGDAIRRRRTHLNLNQAQLAESSGLEQGNISRMERGMQDIPHSKLVALAKALQTTAGRIYLDAEAAGAEVDEAATAFQLTQALGVRHVPLISWVEAGSFAEAVDSYARGTGKRMIQTSLKVGRLAYALEVHGNSMNNPRDDRRSFPDGSIIIVDPARELRSGAMVVARLSDEAETTFKQYIEDAGRRMLVPLNPQFPVIPVDEPMTYCGTVVGRAEESFDDQN